MTCTATSLTLHRPVTSMPLRTRAMVTRWLGAHGLAPELVALGHPVERDVLRRVLRWCEDGDDGPVVRTRHLARAQHPAPWPLTFPVDLIGPSSFVDADGYTFTPR